MSPPPAERERLFLDAGRLPDELKIEYRIQARLGEANAIFSWRRAGESALVEASASARFLIKRFQFAGEARRSGPRGLLAYSETAAGRARAWAPDDEVLGKDWIAAIELPFALASRFEPRDRELEGVMVAGHKPYRTLVSQSRGSGGAWVARVEAWSYPALEAPAQKRAAFTLSFADGPIASAISAKVPFAGEIEALRASSGT